MARIRIINPEFWLDEELSKCSSFARLLYIGLWGICDDNYATFPDRHEWIKIQVFPYENLEIKPLLEELAHIQKLIKFEENGKFFWFIKNFLKYQVVNRPSKPKYPEYKPQKALIITTLNEYSMSTHAEEKRREEKGIFSGEKSLLTNNQPKSMKKYDENNHSDSDVPSISYETGENLNPPPKKEGKNKLALRLQDLFLIECEKNTGTKPVKDVKGYFVLIDAMKYLTEDQIQNKYQEWFASGLPVEQLVSLPRCLSHNEINKYKVSFGIK